VADRVEVLITGDASGLVRATDQASSAMQDFGRATSGLSRVADAFRSDFGRLTAAFGAAQLGVTAVMGAFESAGRAIQAMNAEVIDAERVASKLIAVFDGAEGAAGRLTAQAEALAGSTVFFDDDAIKSAAAAMRGFELTEQEISKLLPVAVNLATVFGTDLENAATKLALGLNGSTRGLREFEIVAKEGADRASIMAQILERGEKAAKGAADAQGGLRGATEGLKKAQGEFNQALGTLLAGPQSAFIQFLTDATNAATGLANKMGGVTESLIKTARVIDPLTGKIVEATGVGGKDLFGPGSLTAQFMKGKEPTKAPEEKKPAGPADRPRGRGADDATRKQEELIRKQDEAAAFERRLLEDKIAANEAQIVKDNKAAQDIIDNFDEANKKRNEETVKAFETAQSLIEQANKDFASGITAAGRLLVDIVRGDASLGGLIRAFGGVAGAAGGALGGPIGAALAGVGVEVVAAIVDGFKPQQTAADKLREAGDRLTQAGQAMTEAERERRIEKAKDIARAAGLTESDIARAMDAARNPNSQPGNRRTQGLPGVGETLTLGPIDAAAVQKNYLENVLGPSKLPGTIAGRPGEGGLLSPGGEAPGPAPQELAKAQSEAAFSELVRIMREIYSIQLDESGKGMTERQPLYVFDVAAGKDEFTRAPRGMFFRPVGSGRGVDAGQSVSGVSANTSNRAAMGRADRGRRMA